MSRVFVLVSIFPWSLLGAVTMATSFETDAVKIEGLCIPKFKHDERHLKNLNKINEILAILSKDELLQVLFLLMDSISCYIYLDVVKKTEKEVRAYLLDIISEKNVSESFLVDVFGTLKKFHILKKLNFCKHQFQQRNHSNTLSEFWKSLYCLCEEIDDEELKSLNNFLFGNPDEMKTFEQTICKLFVCKKIRRNNLEELSKAFLDIKRKDLAQSVLAVSGNEQIEYRIRTPTVGHPCGLAIIVNQEEFCEAFNGVHFPTRTGSRIDRDALDEMWKGFGFHTEVYDNLNSAEVVTLFHNIQENYVGNYDIFVSCLLSHGHADVIYGTDGKAVQIEDLIHLVANECPKFNNKPKLFFVQACQQYQNDTSKSESYSSDNRSDRVVGGNFYSKFTWADVYLAVSTVKGNVSYRDISNGSLFISALVKDLLSNGDKDNIDRVMTRVKNRVYMHQMPIVHSTLRDDVVFKRLRL